MEKSLKVGKDEWRESEKGEQNWRERRDRMRFEL